jgi:hypothetical protein
MPELTEAYVRARIADARNKTALAFAACIAVLLGGLWIVAESTGPAAGIVTALLGLVGILALVIGVELATLPGNARRALRDLPQYRNDPEAFERLYGSIMDFRFAWGRKRAG